METSVDIVRRSVRLVGEVVAETLWPTRCALCDAPGSVLCEACSRDLPFIDWWRACPECGSSFGMVQCDLCNPVALERIGRDHLPFAGCASATVFDEATGKLVRVYKDQGERRLAAGLAAYMVRNIPPAWDFTAVTYVPASKAAFRFRGFDHCEELAREVALRLQARCARTLERPMTHDQRALGGQGRIENLRKGFHPLAANLAGQRFLLVDDVLTTGSTLCAATDALLEGGAQKVFCLTFARV